MARARSSLLVVGLCLAAFPLALTSLPASAASQPTVDLASSGSYAVLAGTAVSSTGGTLLRGDLGISPGMSVTGFGPGVTTGTEHAGDPLAAAAQLDLGTAYAQAAGLPSTGTIMGDLGGLTLGPGVRTAPSSLGLTGPLTLDAAGDPDAVFVFQIGSSLTTASASSVLLIGGAQACHVFWQVGSSATLGTDSAFAGTILASSSITVNTAVTVQGRALAHSGAVTLDDDLITVPTCGAAVEPPVVVPPVVVPPIVVPPVVVPPVVVPPVVVPPVVVAPVVVPPVVAPPVVAPPVVAAVPPVVTPPGVTPPAAALSSAAASTAGSDPTSASPTGLSAASTGSTGAVAGSQDLPFTGAPLPVVPALVGGVGALLAGAVALGLGSARTRRLCG